MFIAVSVTLCMYFKWTGILQDPDVMSLLGDDASDASQLTNITTCSESSNISFMPNKG